MAKENPCSRKQNLNINNKIYLYLSTIYYKTKHLQNRTIMKFIKKHLSTIAISLIIGILLFYAQPLLEWLGQQAVTLFIFMSSSFSNFYYTKVALNDPNLLSDLTAYVSIVILIFLLAFQLISIKSIEWRRKNRETGVTALKITEKNVQKELQSKDFSCKIIRLSNRIRRLSIMLYINITFIIIILLGQYILCKTIMDENTKFHHKTVILLPYIGTEELNKLKSEWALMQTADDYDKIIDTINTLEQTYLTND